MDVNQLNAPFVSAPAASGTNTSDLATRISQFLSEDTIDQTRASLNELKSLMSCYQCAILEVETKFRVLNERFSATSQRNPIEFIKTRIKSPESIREKINRKGLPTSIDSVTKLYDIAGVRVVCSFVDDIYLLADCLLQQDDIRLIEKKDYIANPKGNGYRSLHLIVEVPIFLGDEKRFMPVEVQLRTIAMEFWANLEHKLRYKKNLPDDVSRDITAELYECAQMSYQLDEKMLNVRNVIAGLN